ncbi:hypothetical protein SAMN05444487_101138 [Marininema mesophilum]|uniref:Uncharacterized protein n=1 Tax=Marininema mesophilum TaxID=1048340 RepID=A0A1H2Q7W6_9BACL|nr:hypothetical protein SAMN05444487_101138 [Marininema mesophilum]
MYEKDAPCQRSVFLASVIIYLDGKACEQVGVVPFGELRTTAVARLLGNQGSVEGVQTFL